MLGALVCLLLPFFAWGQTIRQPDNAPGEILVDRSYWTGRLRVNPQQGPQIPPFILEESWFGPWHLVVPAEGLELAPMVNRDVVLRGKYDVLSDGKTRVLRVERAYGAASGSSIRWLLPPLGFDVPQAGILFAPGPELPPSGMAYRPAASKGSNERVLLGQPSLSDERTTGGKESSVETDAVRVGTLPDDQGAASERRSASYDRQVRWARAQSDTLPPPTTSGEPYTRPSERQPGTRSQSLYWSDSPYTVGSEPPLGPWERSCPSCGLPRAAGAHGACPSPERFWLQGDYLHWWANGLELPALVTTSVSGTPASSAGVLGLPTTTVLFGNSEVNDTDQVGWRVSGGVWLGPAKRWGVDLDYFQLDDLQETFQSSSDGSLILARPYLDIVTGNEAAELIAFPGIATGAVSAEAITGWLAAGGRIRWSLCCGTTNPALGGWTDGYRVDVTGGYRFARLVDQVDVRHTSLDVSTSTTTFAEDLFVTGNEFHGGEVGIVWERRRGRWIVTGLGRIALGNNRQTVRIEGRSILDDGTGPQNFTGGILAQSSNIGFFSRDEFAVLPELELSLGLQLTNWARINVGYHFLYLSNVVRAGDVIDRDVNPGLIPPPTIPLTGPARPAFAFHETDFWLQGLTAGIDVRF